MTNNAVRFNTNETINVEIMDLVRKAIFILIIFNSKATMI